ncbi:MAG: tetratricopeptide repeat protein [Elusimicrobium sp.]|jgi:tetratricopeptide (TPR) repeat protein|nr:tetratricopeptide repeat protein [Elusimicrobium sp.]
MGKFKLFFILIFAAAQVFASGLLGRPRQEINPDYSKSVWDGVMETQSQNDARKGYYFMSVGKYDDAVSAFAKAAVKNPNTPEPYVLLGMALYWTGKVDSSISEYKQALTLDKNNQDAHLLLGIAHGWKGDIAAAQAEFETADSIGPARPDVKMNLSSVYAAQKKMELALDYARKAAELAPREALYFNQLGVISEAVGRDEAAEAAFKRAIKLFPGNEDAMLALAATYEKRGNNKEALNYYKKSVGIKPGDFIARLRYANLLYVAGMAQEAKDAVVKAFAITSAEGKGLALNVAYSGVENKSAASPEIENLKNALSRFNPGTEVRIEAEISYRPKDAKLEGVKEKSALEREMLLARAAEQAQSASRSFSRVFILNPSDEKDRAAQIETIAAALQNALSSAPKDSKTQMSIKTDAVQREPVQAAGDSNQNTAYNPRTVGNDMGLWVTGRNWVRFVYEIAPDIETRIEDKTSAGAQADTFDYILMGLAALTLGKGEDGLKNFDAALSQDENNEIALLGKGTAYIILGREDDAAAVYEQVLSINPKNKIAKNNLEFIKSGGKNKK